MGEAQAKVTVLEQELGKSQKIIQKSKKASEVQVMEAWFLQEGMYRTRIAPLLCRLWYKKRMALCGSFNLRRRNFGYKIKLS